MIYPILVIGNTILKEKTKEVSKDYPDLERLIDDLFETMYSCEGVGLAAPQIGKLLRLFVVDAKALAEGENKKYENFKRVLINPVILEESGKEEYFNEGCLSVPTVREDIKRKTEIKVKYYDRNWNEIEESLDGLASRIVQHEFDHIEGVLFTDRLSMLKKRLLRGKITDISRGKVKPKYRIVT